MSLPGYELPLLIILIAVIVIGYLFHAFYLSRITRHVNRTTDERFSRKDLINALRISQGSNFNTVMIFSWCLFIVAFAFLYFLTPKVFPQWNFFKFTQVASDSFGLAIFGDFVIMFIGIFVSIRFPRAYSSYLIPYNLKELNLLTPFVLIGSIMSSVHLATIYPGTSPEYWIIGYVALLLSLILLLSPIIKGLVEEMRT